MKDGRGDTDKGYHGRVDTNRSIYFTEESTQIEARNKHWTKERVFGSSYNRASSPHRAYRTGRGIPPCAECEKDWPRQVEVRRKINRARATGRAVAPCAVCEGIKEVGNRARATGRPTILGIAGTYEVQNTAQRRTSRGGRVSKKEKSAPLAQQDEQAHARRIRRGQARTVVRVAEVVAAEPRSMGSIGLNVRLR